MFLHYATASSFLTELEMNRISQLLNSICWLIETINRLIHGLNLLINGITQLINAITWLMYGWDRPGPGPPTIN